jgi:hypothetical protein
VPDRLQVAAISVATVTIATDAKHRRTHDRIAETRTMF